MDEVRRIEMGIDAHYASYALTSDIRDLVAWRVLTVSEDHCLFIFYDLIKMGYGNLTQSHMLNVSESLEVNKLAVKSMLLRMEKECSYKGIETYEDKISPSVYEKISSLYKASFDYSHICTLFVSRYKNLTNTEVRRNEIKFKYNKVDLEYSILHHHLSYNPTGDGKSPFQVLYELMFINESNPLLQDLMLDTHDKTTLINYAYKEKLISFIKNEMVDHVVDIDSTWVLPCSTMASFREYFKTLVALCIYHIVAIHYNSTRFKIKGYGLDQRVLRIEKEALINLIKNNSTLSLEEIKNITDFLTYGKNVNNPDPALQPLIMTSTGILIPCFLVVTSNFDRNVLTLHSRWDEKHFHGISHLFEKRMTHDLTTDIEGKYFYKKNIMLPNKDGGEIDLIIADKHTKTILVCELRWMIQPSEPNEIFNRQKVCLEKTAQAQKKVEAANRNLCFLLKSMGEDAQYPNDWSVKGVVILEGYSGLMSSSDIVIIPKKVFVRIMKGSKSLSEMSDLLSSYKWLPDNKYGKLTTRKVKFGNYTVLCEGVMAFDTLNYLNQFLPRAITNHRLR